MSRLIPALVGLTLGLIVSFVLSMHEREQLSVERDRVAVLRALLYEQEERAHDAELTARMVREVCCPTQAQPSSWARFGGVR